MAAGAGKTVFFSGIMVGGWLPTPMCTWRHYMDSLNYEKEESDCSVVKSQPHGVVYNHP